MGEKFSDLPDDVVADLDAILHATGADEMTGERPEEVKEQTSISKADIMQSEAMKGCAQEELERFLQAADIWERAGNVRNRFSLDYASPFTEAMTALVMALETGRIDGPRALRTIMGLAMYAWDTGDGLNPKE